MLNWFFRRRSNAVTPAAPAPTAQAARQPPARAPKRPAPAPAGPVEAAAVDWPEQLRAARGDDAALLRVATSAPLLEIKRAAVEALATEDALRHAERAFRRHDRKVHLVAKQRLNAAVATREARVKAQALLERATAMLGEALVPINHVVALDRDWEALPPDALEPGQRTRFAELRAGLDVALRAVSNEQARQQRWAATAKQSLLEWPQAIVAAADHGTTDDVARLRRAFDVLRRTRPDVPATTELDRALTQALQCAALVETRLAWLEAQSEPAAASAPAPLAASPADAAAPDERPEAPGADDSAAVVAQAPGDGTVLTAAQRWDDLPALPDAELARVLLGRHQRWLRARPCAGPAAHVSAMAATVPPRPAHAEAAVAEQRLRLESLVQQAEAALADGRLGQVQQHLQAIDAAVSAFNGAAPPGALRTRHRALRTEFGRLKGWQQWGGGRAREGLVAEAEKLAQSASAAADAGAHTAPKPNLRSLGEGIHALRMRWKELDRLGAAAGPELWQRFDVALKAAFEPVAAQQAALKAARIDNQAAREALLARLDALPVPDTTAASDDGGADWKAVSRKVEHIQLAWRRLGPIEHTVPADARETLQQRLRTGLERIDTPLQDARRAAVTVREELVAAAQALVSEPGRQGPRPDATRQMHELRAAWRDQALQQPLPRALENALWARFKAATDAVFAQRDAAVAARDAELAANVATRESLLERLAALGDETPMAEVERTLADVDAAWRQPCELPRGAAESLEARFRSARAAASELLAARARKRWQAQCDTLASKLALCEEREGAGGDSAELSQRWAAQDALPAAWEQALTLRWTRPVEPGPLPAGAIDDVLLRLEAALELPTPPEWQAARRTLKLLELKSALERGGSAAQLPSQRAQWLSAALCQGGLSAAQSQRLRALVAALRQTTPATVGPPPTAQ